MDREDQAVRQATLGAVTRFAGVLLLLAGLVLAVPVLLNGGHSIQLVLAIALSVVGLLVFSSGEAMLRKYRRLDAFDDRDFRLNDNQGRRDGFAGICGTIELAAVVAIAWSVVDILTDGLTTRALLVALGALVVLCVAVVAHYSSNTKRQVAAGFKDIHLKESLGKSTEARQIAEQMRDTLNARIWAPSELKALVGNLVTESD